MEVGCWLLTSDVIGQWKGLSITGTEIVQVVNSSMVSMDQIPPEFLKAPSVAGLSLLIRLSNIAWTLGQCQWIGRQRWWFSFVSSLNTQQYSSASDGADQKLWIGLVLGGLCDT